MKSILLTCLIIVVVLIVAYLIYMAIGMFLFNLAAKQHGVERTIIKIQPANKKNHKSKRRPKFNKERVDIFF